MYIYKYAYFHIECTVWFSALKNPKNDFTGCEGQNGSVIGCVSKE
jgi:hypothetical protein